VRFLVDTNVLIYPHDEKEPAKARRAAQILSDLAGSGRAALPAQAVAEFANVALRKFGLEPDLILDQLRDLGRSFPVLPLTEREVAEAVRGVRDHGFSYYDAQIWAVARASRIPAVLSEDFAVGATVEGVTFVDPFDEGFDASATE
jgi:predicted nucleic acid-binding protein